MLRKILVAESNLKAEVSSTGEFVNNNADSNLRKQIENGRLNNKVQEMVYRWFSFYERPGAQNSENQKNLLTESAEVLSESLGNSHSFNDYKERVAKLPASWKNSHHILSFDVVPINAQKTQLDMSILYQNMGYDPKGLSVAAVLNYKAVLDSTPLNSSSENPALASSKIENTKNNDLPKFSRIEIKPVKTRLADFQYAFQDHYAKNRMLSVVYHWLNVMERNDAKGLDFKEVLTDDFTLNFSSMPKPIRTVPELDDWIKVTASKIEISTHKVIYLDIKETTQNHYNVEVEFAWNGITKEGGVELEAITHHTWQVIDEPSAPLPKIQTMTVKTLVPFRPIQK